MTMQISRTINLEGPNVVVRTYATLEHEPKVQVKANGHYEFNSRIVGSKQIQKKDAIKLILELE